MKFLPMWYATDSTGAVMQRQPEGGWITLEYLPVAMARREVALRNERLRQTYADNGIIITGG